METKMRKNSKLGGDKRFVVADVDMGLTKITDSAVHQLTRLLFIDQTKSNEEWLVDQARQMKELASCLRRPRGLIPRLAISMGKHGAPFSPETARLCMMHKKLDARVIRRLMTLVANECTMHANRLRGLRLRGYAMDPAVRCWLERMDSITSLWMDEAMFAQVFGRKPETGMRPQGPMSRRDRCEACMLAVFGTDTQALIDTRASLVARHMSPYKRHRGHDDNKHNKHRRHSHSRSDDKQHHGHDKHHHAKHRPRLPPRLMRLVDAWIDNFNDDVAATIRMQSESLAPGIEVLRRASREQRQQRRAQQPNRVVERIQWTEITPEGLPMPRRTLKTPRDAPEKRPRKLTKPNVVKASQAKDRSSQTQAMSTFGVRSAAMMSGGNGRHSGVLDNDEARAVDIRSWLGNIAEADEAQDDRADDVAPHWVCVDADYYEYAQGTDQPGAPQQRRRAMPAAVDDYDDDDDDDDNYDAVSNVTEWPRLPNGGISCMSAYSVASAVPAPITMGEGKGKAPAVPSIRNNFDRVNNINNTNTVDKAARLSRPPSLPYTAPVPAYKMPQQQQQQQRQPDAVLAPDSYYYYHDEVDANTANGAPEQRHYKVATGTERRGGVDVMERSQSWSSSCASSGNADEDARLLHDLQRCGLGIEGLALSGEGDYDEDGREVVWSSSVYSESDAEDEDDVAGPGLVGHRQQQQQQYPQQPDPTWI